MQQHDHVSSRGRPGMRGRPGDTAQVSHTPCYRLIDSAVTSDGTLESFEALPTTSSAWGPQMQHGGPVTALMVRAAEKLSGDDGMRTSRVTSELLGVVPVGQVRVRARVARPGRRVALVHASMEEPTTDGAWRTVATAAVWRMRTDETAAVARTADQPLAMPDEEPRLLADHPLSFAWWEGGFVDALEWRIVAEQQSASTVAWARMFRPLVLGEETSSLQRLVAFADTANGVGARLDPARYSFVNTEMTVHLFEPPHGEWFGLEAQTSVGSDGIGMSAGVLHAPGQVLGRVSQSLLVQRR